MDVNKDGNPDVLLGNPNDYTELLVGKGDGTFIDTALALGQRPLAVSAADLDGDGYPELLVGQTSSVGGTLAVFQNANNVWLAVNPKATQTTVVSSANPSTVGESITFTATVAPTSGTGTPTGTVTFLDNGTSIGSGTLDNTGKATLMTSALTQGTHPITAQYSGDSTFGVSTSTPVLNQVVNAVALVDTSTAVTSSLNPSTVGQSVTFTATVTPTSGTTIPTGSVVFFDGATMLGSNTLDGTGKTTYQTSSLTAATHSITGQYTGDTTFSGSTSPALSQVVNPSSLVGTTTAVASSANPSITGSSVTFTATVTPASGTKVPTGSVKFLDGSTLLGSNTLDGTGKTTYQTSSLAVGSHSITGQYAGDSSFSGSTSPVLTQTVNNPPTFTISAPSVAMLSVAEGSKAGPFTFTVTPVNNSTQTITFACTGLPSLSSCLFSSASVTLDGTHTTAPISVTIMTTGNSLAVPAQRLPPPTGPAPWVLFWGLLALAANVLHFRRFRAAQFLSIGVALVIMGLIVACGGSTPKVNTGTPPGSYTVTVTGNGMPGNVNVNAPSGVALTVTN